MILLFYFMGMVVFYTIAFFVIRWLMRRYLSDSGKSWHFWARRGIWSGLFVLMTFDQFYYYFVVVRGHCIPDKTRVYPAPPMDRYVAGPYPKDAPELANYNPDVSHLQKTNEQIRFAVVTWPCKVINGDDSGTCLIKPLISEKFVENYLFGNKREGFRVVDDQAIYNEGVYYEQEGHWLTKMLTGSRLALFSFNDHQCSILFKAQQTPMIVK